MEHTLSASDKYEIQQNFRRYIRLKERFDTARGAYVTSRASKVWVAGVVALLFALASNFFLGVATVYLPCTSTQWYVAGCKLMNQKKALKSWIVGSLAKS
jgi:hypothetical protein